MRAEDGRWRNPRSINDPCLMIRTTWDEKGGIMVTRQIYFLVTVCIVLFAAGCATRPLVLNPRLKPPDVVNQQSLGTLIVVPFVDNTPGEDRGNKRFQEEPIEVLNDALLNTLRLSQGFKNVNKGTETATADLQLSGKLLSLKTDESMFKFGLASSTMDITAICTSSFRLINVKTGAVLVEDTITTNGLGAVRIFGGGQQAQYDSTYGYEESMSQAISRNATLIATRLLEVLAKGQ